MTTQPEQNAARGAKESIIAVELDDETIRCLAVLGNPTEVLARLAVSAAHGVLRSGGHSQRALTNESLKVERDKADTHDAESREADDAVADEMVRISRDRADLLVQSARDDADRDDRPPSTAIAASSSDRERTRADAALDCERSTADAVLRHQREGRKRTVTSRLTIERESTDKELSSERSHADMLLVDQREANAQMVRATLRAQELMDEAEAAKERAEDSERKLRVVAEFREMFIGILGHDLRNPLSAITIRVALLLGPGHLAEQDAETVAGILRCSQRMTRMITQLLDLTRARLGAGLPIELKPTDLREVCGHVVEEFEAVIRLQVEGDVTGNWDQDRLAEALSNLVGNAIEHAVPGTAVIVKAHSDGSDVVVEITNQGDPIPADVLPFIFEPFRQAKGRERSPTGNLGLGLYIAHQIVLSHSGTFDVHSADGTTTFLIRLPRRPG